MNLSQRLNAAKGAPEGQTAAEKAAAVMKEADQAKTEQAIAAKVAHVEALKEGLRCFQNLRLNQFFLGNGQKVSPTTEGVFIAVTPEIEKTLDYYATKHWGLVEEIKAEETK